MTDPYPRSEWYRKTVAGVKLPDNLKNLPGDAARKIRETSRKTTTAAGKRAREFLLWFNTTWRPWAAAVGISVATSLILSGAALAAACARDAECREKVSDAGREFQLMFTPPRRLNRGRKRAQPKRAVLDVLRRADEVRRGTPLFGRPARVVEEEPLDDEDRLFGPRMHQLD